MIAYLINLCYSILAFFPAIMRIFFANMFDEVSDNHGTSIDKINRTQALKLTSGKAKVIRRAKLGKPLETTAKGNKKVEREEIVFPRQTVSRAGKKNQKVTRGAETINKSDFSFRAVDSLPLGDGEFLDRTLSDSGIRGKGSPSKKKPGIIERNLKLDNNEIQSSNLYSAPLQKKYSSHHNLASTSHSAVRLQPKRNYYKPGSSKSADSEKMLSNILKGSMSCTELPRKIDSSAIRSHPEQFVHTALKKIEGEEWTGKVEGIHMIVQIAETSPQALSTDLHQIVVGLLNECKNLRSSVSRVAIIALGRLFNSLNTRMDSEVDKVCLVLLQKAGDVSNAFIRKDATVSIEKMVKNASANKVLAALIASGAKSKNNTIRTECAASVSHLIERVGPRNALHSKDIGKLIEVLNAFAKDPHPAVRYQGKYGLQLLKQNSDELETVIREKLGEGPWRNVKSVLENIQKRGLEGGASDAPMTSLNRSGSIRKGGALKFTRLSDTAQRDLDVLRADLISNKWQQRLEALKRFEEMAVSNARVVSTDTKLVEAFIARLSDINSKIALEAMETYMTILYPFAKYFSTETHLRAVLNQLISALMSHLPSRSEEHRRLAKDCTEETLKQIDNIALAPAVAAATKQSNVKQRPFMLRCMNGINLALYPTKPKLIEVLSLPILWENLRSPSQMNTDSEVKKAMKEFVRGLSKCFGNDALLEQANAYLNPAQKRTLELLL